MMALDLKIKPVSTKYWVMQALRNTRNTRNLAQGLLNTKFSYLNISPKRKNKLHKQCITKYWGSSNQTSSTGKSQTNLSLPLCSLFHTQWENTTERFSVDWIQFALPPQRRRPACTIFTQPPKTRAVSQGGMQFVMRQIQGKQNA